MKFDVKLGLGLIGIGRPWGFARGTVPPIADVTRLLHSALGLGIEFFDTAASYGSSEERLGQFLKELEAKVLQRITVATKFGDHWNAESGASYVDHSYDALCKSLDRSLGYLPKIDLLQLHKATTKVLTTMDVRKAFGYAKSCGIRLLGASVTDFESVKSVAEDVELDFVQLPFNKASSPLRDGLALACSNGKWALVNRPFGEGRLVSNLSLEAASAARLEAFRFILDDLSRGIILTGTRSESHLRENVASFNDALSNAWRGQ